MTFGYNPTEQAYAQQGFDIGSISDDRAWYEEVGATVASPFVDIGRSVFNLVNVEEWTGIRDIEKPEWATPNTVAGHLIGGVAQFAIPYWGVGRLLTGAAAASRGGSFVQWLSGAKGGKLTSSIINARKAGQVNAGMARFLSTAAEGAGRAAIKGAPVDFLVFEGAEGNLSSMIQSFPGLENPITEFLATDEENTEVGNRFRNVLEGFALGGMFDTLFAVRRGRKALSLAAQAGKSSDEQVEAYVKAVDDALEFRGDLQNNEIDARLAQNLDEEVELPPLEPGGEPRKVTNRDIQNDIEVEVAGTFDQVKRKLAASMDPDELRNELARRQDELASARKLSENRQKRLRRLENKRRKGIEPSEKELAQEQRDLAKEDVYQRDLQRDPRAEERLNAVDLTEADDAMLESVAREFDITQGVDDLDPNLAGNPRRETVEELARGKRRKTDANLSTLLESPDGAAMLYRAVERMGATGIPETISNKAFLKESLQDYRSLTGMTHGQFDRTLQTMLDEDGLTIRRIAGKAAAVRLLSRQIGEELVPQIKALNEALDPGLEATKKMALKLREFTRLFNYQLGIGSEFGRALQRQNVNLDPSKNREAYEKAFKTGKLDAIINMTDDTYDPTAVKVLLDDMNRIIGSENPIDNIVALKRWQESSMLSKAQRVAQDLHINSLLSAPTTHIVNFGSGLMMSFWEPMERMLFAGLESVMSSDTGRRQVARQVAQLEWKTVTNLVTDFESIRKAVKQSGGEVFGTGSKLEGGRFSAAEQWGRDRGAPPDGLFSKLLGFIRWPSKAIGMEDTTLRLWNARARAKAVFEVDALGRDFDPEQAVRYASDQLDILERQRGTLREEAATLKALRQAGQEAAQIEDPVFAITRAQELVNLEDTELDTLIRAQEEAVLAGKRATWTQDSDGIFGAVKDVGNYVTQRIPATRFFLPFINTPANIAQFGWDRSVGAVWGGMVETMSRGARLAGMSQQTIDNIAQGMSKVSRDLASPDAGVRASARARMSWGIGTVGTVISVASMVDDEGMPRITGSGPTDPDVRRTLQAAGWQPYSVRVGDRYYSYSRLDPIASLVAMMVDSADGIRHADEEGRSAFTGGLVAAAASVANNITSKTYAKGLSDMLDLVTEPEKNFDRVVGGAVMPAVVPLTGLQSAVARTTDPYLRDIQSFTERALSRTPGLSNLLPPKRDLLGQPIKIEANEWTLVNPFRISKVKDTVVEKELSRFAYGFSEPSTTKAGVDLLDQEFFRGNQPAYDRYQELYGTVKIKGKDVRQALRVEIGKATYQRLDPERGPFGERSPRIDVLNGIIRRYRQRAWRELLRENPALKSATDESSASREARREGRRPLTL